MTVIEIPLVAGSEQRADSAILPNGALKSVHNLRLERPGRLVRREGYALWSPLVDVATYRVAQWKSCQLSFGTSSPPKSGGAVDRYAYANDIGTDDIISLQTGTPLDNPSVTVGPTRLIASRRTSHCDIGCACVNGLLAIGYEEDNYLYIDVIDVATNTVLLTETISKSAQAGATVMACGDYIVVLYRDTAAIKYAMLDASADARAFTTGTVTGCTDLSVADIAWDATAITGENYFVVAYNDSTATRLTARLIHILAGSTAASASDTVAADAADGIAVAAPSISGPFYCVFGNAVSGALRCVMWNGALSSGNQTSIVTLDVSYDPGDGPFTINVDSSPAIALWSDTMPSIHYCTLILSPAGKGTTQRSFGATVYSKPLSGHLWLQYYRVGSLQRHYRLARSESGLRQLGKCCFGTAGTVPQGRTFSPIPCVSQHGGVNYVGLGEVVGGSVLLDVTSQLATVAYAWEFSDEKWGSNADVGGLHLAGFGHSMFDGKRLLSNMTPQAPENLDITKTSGSFNQTGTFEYRVVYVTVDANENRWRSAPSEVQSVDLSAQTATIVVYNESTETHSEGNYVELYKRHTDGSYRLAEIADAPGSSSWVEIEDTKTDLNEAEILYTEGDEPASFPTPPSQMCVEWNSRLWVVCGARLYYSHQYVDVLGSKNAPWLVESLCVQLPSEVTGLAPLDNALIIFTEKTIHSVSGDGPNRRGQNPYPFYPQQISSEVGCADWRSVAIFRDGIVFRSTRGMELLPRGTYVVQPVGDVVRDVVQAYPVTTGVVTREEDDQIRWTLRNDTAGTVLCYNYINQAWTTESAPAYDCAGIWGGSYVVGSCRAALSPYKAQGVWMQGEQWTDDDGDGGSITYEASIETGEVRVGGSLGGWGRLRRVNLVGELLGNATMKIGVAFDGDSSFGEEDDLAWTYSSDAPLRQEYAPARQKCETARIRFRDSCTTEGYKLHALRLDVKEKTGPARLASGKRG
jgi:hypothetical protein